MAIQLKLDYSKKLGLPQYSSHQFGVSLTAEVNDVAQIPTEVERIYRVLQDAVDGQIVAPGFVPGGEPASSTKPAGVGTNNGDDWKCSPAQKNLSLNLVEQQGRKRRP